MNIHENARLTPIGRERLVRQVESGQTPETAARRAGVCPRTVRKWLARFRAESVAGLQDRSSRPHGCIARRQARPWRGSRRCGGSASPASRSRATWACRRQPSAASCVGWPEPDRGAGAGRAGAALRARAPGRADPHRSRSSAVSSVPDTGSRATARARVRARGSAGRSFTWPSTIIPGWPMRRSCPTRSAARACASCSTPCGSSGGMHPDRARYERQWQRFQITPLRQGPAPARHQAQANPALHADNKRQGRALRPNIAPGVGLSESLRNVRSAPQRTQRVPLPDNGHRPHTSLGAKPPITRLGLSNLFTPQFGAYPHHGDSIHKRLARAGENLNGARPRRSESPRQR